MTYVIGIMGASGSGKSTLAQKLEKILSKDLHVLYVPSSGRKVWEYYQKKYGIAPKDVIYSEGYSAIQMKILQDYLDRYELAFMTDSNVIILDRTIYDIWTYHYLYAPLSPLFLKFENEFSRAYRTVYYDMILHCPPLDDVEKDGLRDPFLEDRESFNITLDKIMPNHIDIKHKDASQFFAIASTVRRKISANMEGGEDV